MDGTTPTGALSRSVLMDLRFGLLSMDDLAVLAFEDMSVRGRAARIRQAYREDIQASNRASVPILPVKHTFKVIGAFIRMREILPL